MLEEAIIIGLSAWRVAALLSYEPGPFDIFQRFRGLLGISHRQGEPVSWPDTFFAQVFSCVWCLGLYVAAAMWGLWQINHSVVIVIAASSVLIAAERWNHNVSR